MDTSIQDAQRYRWYMSIQNYFYQYCTYITDLFQVEVWQPRKMGRPSNVDVDNSAVQLVRLGLHWYGDTAIVVWCGWRVRLDGDGIVVQRGCWFGDCW